MNNYKRKFNKGFTLIELLVVVGIISLLSSIVFASLTTGRAKSKDASIMSSVGQLRILMEQNFNDYGSYTFLQPGLWFDTTASCNAGLTQGNYAAQAAKICASIVAQASTTWAAANNKLYLGTNASFPVTQYYAIMAALPYKNTFFCMGSSGQNSSNTGSPGTPWTNPGCFGAP